MLRGRFASGSHVHAMRGPPYTRHIRQRAQPITGLHTTPISGDDLARARALRDLSDPRHGLHAMQLLLERLRAGLEALWHCRSLIHRDDPVVSVEDNYDRLRYAPDAVTRDARYSRY